MQIFAIRDDELESDKNIAYLIYYEKSKRFYIEIPDDADMWETPLLLSELFQKGIRTIDAYWSKVWVQQRIVPQDRQNIGQILKANHLEEYDEFALLMLGEGRCAQDHYYLKPIESGELSAEMKSRFDKRVYDVVALDDMKLLVFFQNGEIKKMDLPGILMDREKAYLSILKKKEVYERAAVQPGGYGICWGEQLNIASERLYEADELIPLQQSDFIQFARLQVVNTAEASEILDCSRQNMNELVKKKKLHPIKQSAKNTLFYKRELEQRNWI